MPTEVIMPALGMSQETGHLIAWLKNDGDQVERGEPIMEVETDKTTVEIEASASGTLTNLTAQPGDDVPVGSVIALILAPGEAAPQSEGQLASGNGAQQNRAAVAATVTPVARRMAAALGVDVAQIKRRGKRVTRADVEAFMHNPAQSSMRLIPASPKARRLAHERGIDLNLIGGTGPDGAVLAADVPEPAPAPLIPAPEPAAHVSTQEVIPVGPLWRRMAERLTESWQTVPQFYLKREMSAQSLTAWRTNLQNRTDVKITYTDLIVKLVAAALRRHPQVNGQWAGESITLNPQINIGLAVAVEQGLIVPVIHDADALGVTAIARRRQEIVARAQDGRLKLDDLQGATFTISNLGMYGADEFYAIVNPPQAAILAVGRITERVVPRDGQAVILPMMTLGLTCDHRVVDGARGARFLDTLARLIEDPLMQLD